MYDLLILGGGCAGLSAAIYAARAGLRFLVLEQDGWGGGQISSAHRVQNYPGLPEISGAELGESLREHALRLGAEIQYGEIGTVSRTEKGFAVSANDGELYEAKTVIAATGASPRSLGVPGEAEHVGAGVSYCAVCDGAFYAGKDVLVVGGGDTAVEDALYLTTLCRRVTLVLRRDQFRAAKTRVELLREQENITILTETTVTEIGDGFVQLQHKGQSRKQNADGLFVAVGAQPSTACLASFPILTEDGYVRADESGTTSIPGLFAAGDIRRKPLRQAITAVADGANAVHSVAAYLKKM